MNTASTGTIKLSTSSIPGISAASSARPSRYEAKPASSSQDENAFSRSLTAKQRQMIMTREQSKPESELPEQTPLQAMAQQANLPADTMHSSVRGIAPATMLVATHERMVLQSNLDSSSLASQTSLSGIRGADTPQTWQASLPAAGSVPMQLTASYHPSSPASQAMWAVSVVSPGAESAAFARQATRLTERLQERLAGRGAGVRVEVNRDDAVASVTLHGQSVSTADRDER